MPKRILVIDDDKAVRESFTYALHDESCLVESAASGEEGLASAQAQMPDLIFLDLRMPGIDGVETLRRLQKCCAQTPVYIVTAFRRDYFAALAQAAAEGLHFEVMEKPLENHQIQAIVRSIFGTPQVT